MDFVKATTKISKCIDSAQTIEHHKAIELMIENVERYAKMQRWWDKTILGAVAMLAWQNVFKWENTKEKIKNNLVDSK